MIVAGVLVLLISLVVVARFVLSRGLILDNGSGFLTHNVFFSLSSSGVLRLKARGGKLTDKFDLAVSPEEIDFLSFSCGHRPMDNRLDKSGYLVYRLIHSQQSSQKPAVKTRIGDFTLHPAAQKRFRQFTDQLSNLRPGITSQ